MREVKRGLNFTGIRRATRWWIASWCLAAVFTGVPAAETAESPAPLVLILDASGSMWGQIQKENKIVIARRVVGELVGGLPEGQQIGLVAYGHRREGDCDDIETVLPIAALDRAGFKATVDRLNPKGKTPITASVKQAFSLIEQAGAAATVILVSDGLETCGGDPCAAVKLAKDNGLEFVMHVVGFDVAGEDVSSLQCAAQAGGGMFLSAENADELGVALERAVAMAADVPAGRLVVRGIRNGQLHDVGIIVTDEAGKMVGGARTYSSESTNPSSIPLPDGKFDVKIQAIGIRGATSRQYPIQIAGGSTVERTEDFSTGEVSVGVTRNGALADAVYTFKVAGTKEQAAAGRTYTKEERNPAVVTLTAGAYDVSVKGIEIEGGPVFEFGTVNVLPAERSALSHAFVSGDLKVKIHRSGKLVDATVQVYGQDGRFVAGARTYNTEKSNPTTFILEPAVYGVRVQEVKGVRTESEVVVKPEDTVTLEIDLDAL